MDNSIKFESTKFQINEHEYEVRPFPARANLNLFKKFGSIVGESFKSIFSSIDNGMGELGQGIYLLLNALHQKDHKSDFVIELLSQTTRDGRAINSHTFDEFYTGNMEEMIEALKKSIEVHFKGFLPKGQLFGNHSMSEAAITESSGS